MLLFQYIYIYCTKYALFTCTKCFWLSKQFDLLRIRKVICNDFFLHSNVIRLIIRSLSNEIKVIKEMLRNRCMFISLLLNMVTTFPLCLFTNFRSTFLKNEKRVILQSNQVRLMLQQPYFQSHVLRSVRQSLE